MDPLGTTLGARPGSIDPLSAAGSRRPSAVLTLESNDIIAGFEAVRKAGDLHGFPESHVEKMMEFAQQHNVVIAFRPVNPLSTSLIEDDYPTKPLEIKGKSAEWGPHAGLIPVNQALSKAGDPVSANEKVQQCIDAGHAKAIPLELSQARVNELESKGLIKLMKKPGSKDFTMMCKDHETMSGTLSNDEPPKYQIRHGKDPLLVLGKVDGPGAGKPFTADYDLLMFAPHISDYGPEDMPREGGRGRGSSGGLHASLGPRRGSLMDLVRRNSSIGQASEQADPGTISARLTRMLPELNKALGREPENALVHHGADTENPYTDMQSNLPCLFFSPGNVGGIDGVAVAKTQAGLQKLFQDTKNEKFQFFANDQWESTFNIKRDGLFNQEIFSSPPHSASASRRGSSSAFGAIHENFARDAGASRRRSSNELAPHEQPDAADSRGRIPLRLNTNPFILRDRLTASPSRLSPSSEPASGVSPMRRGSSLLWQGASTSRRESAGNLLNVPEDGETAFRHQASPMTQSPTNMFAGSSRSSNTRAASLPGAAQNQDVSPTASSPSALSPGAPSAAERSARSRESPTVPAKPDHLRSDRSPE